PQAPPQEGGVWGGGCGNAGRPPGAPHHNVYPRAVPEANRSVAQASAEGLRSARRKQTTAFRGIFMAKIEDRGPKSRPPATGRNDDIGEAMRLRLYGTQVLLREAEQRAFDLFLQNLVKGT